MIPLQYTFYIIRFLLFLGFIFIPISVEPQFIDQYTDIKWCILYWISLGVGSTLLFSKKKLLLPKNQLLGILSFSLIVFYWVSIFKNSTGHYGNQILDWICFMILLIGSYQSAHQASSLLPLLCLGTRVATLIVLVYGFLQSFNIHLITTLTTTSIPSSLFGFQNITAEFIGVSCLFQLFDLQTYPKKSLFSKGWCFCLFILSGYYLWQLQCRSVFLALFIAIFLSFLIKKIKKNRKIILLATTALFIIFFQVFYWNSSLLSRTKNSNIALRLARWANSLAMIQNQWLGIGPGRFEFEYLPYHNFYYYDSEVSEKLIVRTPHNGYLQSAVEEGVIFTFLLLGTLFVFIQMILKKIKSQSPYREEMIFFLSLFIFILIDAIFAFPMGCSFVFFTLAVLLGFSLHWLQFKTVAIPKPLLLLPLIIILPLSTGFFLSKSLENNFAHSYEQMVFACRICPANWHACITQNKLELQKQNYRLAEKTARQILTAAPHNFLALFNLGAALIYQKKYYDACQVLSHYDHLFLDKSQLHAYLLHHCAHD